MERYDLTVLKPTNVYFFGVFSVVGWTVKGDMGLTNNVIY